MDWTSIKSDFEWDGSWRDVYVLEASLDDWSKVWTAIRRFAPTSKFQIGDYSGPMPERRDWETAFGGLTSTLCVRVGRIDFYCHFFGGDEIEFDLDPRSVEGLEDAADIERFMALLGEVTAKQVILTYESAKSAVIARYDPGHARLMWLPAEGANATS